MFETKVTKAPSKTFLLGEYSVLVGGPAMVQVRDPYFVLEKANDAHWAIPEGSPADRLLKKLELKLPEPNGLKWTDPQRGRGGLGGSSAEFVLLLKQLQETHSNDPIEVWNLYRELHRDEVMIPSGADVLAQWLDQSIYFNPEERKFSVIGEIAKGYSLRVYLATGQAGRKVRTHEHLAALKSSGFPNEHGNLLDELSRLTQDGFSQWTHARMRDFGETLNAYSAALKASGLEVEATSEDLGVLRNCPSVLGAKGSGALQADSLIVLIEGNSSEADRLALDRGLEVL